MPARRLVLLGTIAVLCLAPLAAAGSGNDPEVVDANDDVAINGGKNCGLPPTPPFNDQCLWPVSTDFEWGNGDINRAWVNDTADALLFTAEMKSATGFV